MPFPYELYPKAKETHCLNLPEISISRPPFPGSIRTADGCFWGERNNNSYADTTITASDGTSYKYGTVFTEKTTKGEGIACSSYANCYIGCSCNTSNGWYSTCQGNDCKSATDNHYTGVNSLSAGKSISDVASISASGANSGISAMASGVTTCYKKKTCSEGGYYDSVPADQKCSSKSYNGYSCYTGCSYKTCSDYGYNSSIPSGKTCTPVYPRSGLTCYKDCKDDTPAKDFYVHISGGGSGITGNGTLGAFIDKGGPLSSVDVFICFTCGVGCLSGTATVAQKLDNLGSYSGCYNNIPEYDGNTCYISGVGLLEDTVYEGDTFTVSGKKYKLICK